MPHKRLWFPLMVHDGCADGPRRPHGRSGPGHWPGPRRGRLGVVGGSVLAAFVLAACSSASSSHPPASKPPVGKPSPGATPTRSASNADGPLACVTAGRATGGNGPWKLVTPPTLCQLQLQTSHQFKQSGQQLVDATKALLLIDDAGTVTSALGVTYQGSSDAAQRASSGRSVSVVGFDGRFRPAAALIAVEEAQFTYTNLPPGPHGGMLACANTEGSEDCIWATHTTLCDITIIDPTGELIGGNSGANAVRIRDVLEVPG
jgi:hypothetical protein